MRCLVKPTEAISLDDGTQVTLTAHGDSYTSGRHEDVSSADIRNDIIVPENIRKLIDELEMKLPYGNVLHPGTLSYERAVFIGNLLFRTGITPHTIALPRNVAQVQTDGSQICL